MVELLKPRLGVVPLTAFLLVLDALVYRIGFHKPAPIVNPAY